MSPTSDPLAFLQLFKLFWKQLLIGGYAVVTAVRGVFMMLMPRPMLRFMRRMKERVASRLWPFRRRLLPALRHDHQVLVVRVMGAMSIVGASALLWWLVNKGMR